VPYVGLYFDMKGYIIVPTDGWYDYAGLCLPNWSGGDYYTRMYIPMHTGSRRLVVNDQDISALLDKQLIVDWLEPPIFEWLNRAAGYRRYYFFNPLIPVRVFGKMFYAIALERGKKKPFHIDFFVYMGTTTKSEKAVT
jgi:hypothetical protein